MSTVPADAAWDQPVPFMIDGIDYGCQSAVSLSGHTRRWSEGGSNLLLDENMAATRMVPMCEYLARGATTPLRAPPNLPISCNNK